MVNTRQQSIKSVNKAALEGILGVACRLSVWLESPYVIVMSPWLSVRRARSTQQMIISM